MRYRLEQQIERANERIEKIKRDIDKWKTKLAEVDSNRNPRELKIISDLRTEKRRAIRYLRDKFALNFEAIGICYGVTADRARTIYNRARWDKEFFGKTDET